MTEFNKKVAAYVNGDETKLRTLARHFGASLPTVARWVTGENEPHVLMQPSILEFIAAESA